MRNSFLCIAIAALLVFLDIKCGTSDHLVNPAQTVPAVYDWTNYRLGHWEYDNGIGWTWVPGYVWSSSQVVWFTGYEYLHTAPLPPPDVMLPRPTETESAVQGSFTGHTRKVHGGFDEPNLQAILDKIRIHRVAAATREILRANFAMDFPLTLFMPEKIPAPGPPPAPRFFNSEP